VCYWVWANRGNSEWELCEMRTSVFLKDVLCHGWIFRAFARCGCDWKFQNESFLSQRTDGIKNSKNKMVIVDVHWHFLSILDQLKQLSSPLDTKIGFWLKSTKVTLKYTTTRLMYTQKQQLLAVTVPAVPPEASPHYIRDGHHNPVRVPRYDEFPTSSEADMTFEPSTLGDRKQCGVKQWAGTPGAAGPFPAVAPFSEVTSPLYAGAFKSKL